MSDNPSEIARFSQLDQKTELDDLPSTSASSSSTSTPTENDWKPCSKDVLKIHERMLEGVNPREILRQLIPDVVVDSNADDSLIWQAIVEILTEPPIRSKLDEYNTLDDAVQLIRSSSKIISVSCGIPDFRSRNGIYVRLKKDFPDLPRPEAMFDLEYFRKNPRPFYEFAREIFPGQYQPSLCHRFVKELESRGKLLRNYTQNIDVLEVIAGIQRVVLCHGSFATASCCACKYQVECESIKEDVLNKKLPRCPKCPTDVEFSFMKPDIVFFGEDLPAEFHERFTADKDEADLLVVIGSSLKVRPVALVPNSVPHHVPQILINREPLNHLNFDIELLGNCDAIVSELCHRLGDDWTKLSNADHPLRETRLSNDCSAAGGPNLKRSFNVQHEPAKRPRFLQPSRKSMDEPPSTSNFNGRKEAPDLETLRRMYKPRMRNLATDLRDGTYLFVPPNRSIFTGAEIFVQLGDDDDSSSSDDDYVAGPKRNHGSREDK